MNVRESPWSPAKARRWRQRWDEQQTYLVPDRELRFDVMLDWLEATVGRRPRCLDLGCGTGAVAERILDRFPQARCVGVDHDPVLLRIGSSGLGSVGGRMRWVDADLRSAGWPGSLPRGRFDAAVSSTALHWLTGVQLARCYRSLTRVLRPQGVFLNADMMAYDAGSVRLRKVSRALSRRAWTRSRGDLARWTSAWTRWWADVEHEPALRPELELRAQRFPHEHTGTPTPDLEGHRRRLVRSGFRESELVWSIGENRILAAVR
ncbi:MAG: class I SAM-dependent methyltransferase [Thermoplasmata archaeon]|nr:class I SAM-dependent methyltransferase [Thermoplasmata archaeon]